VFGGVALSAAAGAVLASAALEAAPLRPAATPAAAVSESRAVRYADE